MSDKQKKPCDEATLKRMAEMRKRSLETRKMKAELKKVEKQDSKEALRKAYEERVLKKKIDADKKQEPIEETDNEIYEKAVTVESDAESEVDDVPPPKPTRVPKGTKPKAVPVMETHQEPNWKQEYYKMKAQKLQEQQQQAQFYQSYTNMPPAVHVADIARNQLKAKVDKELMQRVYNDLFNC